MIELSETNSLLSSVSLSAKNFFRVSYRTGGQLQSHCFQASDTFNKQQWINCIRQAKEAAALTGDQLPETGVSLCCEDERRMWGETETGPYLKGETGPGGGTGLCLGEELPADGRTGLGSGGEMGTDDEARRGTSEAGTGAGADEGRGVEVLAEPGAGADWKMDGRGGGEALSGGAGEKEVMEEEEEERRGTEKEAEVDMDTGEVESLRCEELAHRC